MADETIQLSKPLYEQGGGAARSERGPAARRPVPAFAGFWIRFLALVFDILVVVVLHNLLAQMGMRETLFAIAPWCPLIGLLAMLVAFVAVPAWVLPGQTLGKKMLRLRVVTVDGANPPVSVYLARFAIIFALFLVQWLILAATTFRGAPPEVTAVQGLLWALMASLYLTQVTLFIVNPVRQGIHDLWAGTHVVRLDCPDPVPAHALANLSELAVTRANRARRTAMIMLPALFLVLGSQIVFHQEGPAEAHRREVQTALRAAGNDGVVFQTMLDPRHEPAVWLLVVRAPHDGSVAWDEVADSAALRTQAEQLLDVAEREFNPATPGLVPSTEPEPPAEPAPPAVLPVGGALFAVSQDYTLVPGIPWISSALAGGQRVEMWHRQYRRVSTVDGLLPGTPLVPFTVSPELTAAPASP